MFAQRSLCRGRLEGNLAIHCFKRCVVIAGRKITINMLSLTGEKLLDCLFKFRMLNPVKALGLYRPEPSGNFMFTLSTWIKALNTLCNCIFDPLMKARFKVQAIDIIECPPVAAVEVFFIF